MEERLSRKRLATLIQEKWQESKVPEGTITKTNDGGLADMRKERKVIWVFPSENVTHCPVRLIDKYISLCPSITSQSKKDNFYHHRLEKTNPAQWYSEQMVSINTMKKVVTNMLKSVDYEGFYTNHSLRCKGATRLFQSGIERKLVTEVTGHS